MTGSWQKRHVQAEAQRKANASGRDMALFSRYTVEAGRREWAFCANAGLPGREWRFESWVKPDPREPEYIPEEDAEMYPGGAGYRDVMGWNDGPDW